MLTIIYISFNFTINVTYRPFKLLHVDDMDWVLLKYLGWVIILATGKGLGRFEQVKRQVHED